VIREESVIDKMNPWGSDWIVVVVMGLGVIMLSLSEVLKTEIGIRE